MGLFPDSDKKAGPGQGAVAPVEAGKPAAQNPTGPAGVSAVATAPKFGGLRGGRKRADGLIPGSAEAAEADRKKDAERKQQERAAATAAVAASQPLPSKLSPIQSELPAPSSNPVAGVAVAPAPFVPWSAEIVKPFTSELIPIVEAVRVRNRTEKATAAGLPKDFVKEIEKSAQWPAAAKKNLDTALPRLTAKWLNRTGLSAEYAEEVAVGSALLMIWTSDNAVTKRLDKLIEQRKEEQRKAEKTRDASQQDSTLAALAKKG